MNQNKWSTLSELYINKGLRIFPVIKNGKTPLIKEWQNDCSSDFMQILYFLEGAKDCNWGLPCAENNLFILDLDRHDPQKDGVENFKKLEQDLGITVTTLTQQTPSNGIHLIFKSDDELKQVEGVANAFADYPGIDLRNRNYIVVEPSIINEKHYKFLNNIEPQLMPTKLKEYILQNAGTKTEKKKTPYEKPKSVEKGDRDNQLFQYINQLYYKNHLDFDEIMILAKHFNENVLEEPFSERDVKYKVKKAFEKDRGNCILIRLPEE